MAAAGQGANSALESCKVLGSVLAEAGGDASRVPQLFTSARLADMHALNELDAKAYSFFRCAPGQLLRHAHGLGVRTLTLVVWLHCDLSVSLLTLPGNLLRYAFALLIQPKPHRLLRSTLFQVCVELACADDTASCCV